MQQVSLGDNGRFGTGQTELFPTEIPEQLSFCSVPSTPPHPFVPIIFPGKKKKVLRFGLLISGKDATSATQ